MANPFKTRILLWPLVLVALLLIAGAIFLVIKVPAISSLFGSHTEENSSQLITSITRTEEVSLVSLGIQGIDSKKTKGKDPFFGLEIPGGDNATFIQYEFKAKLGIDGSKTKIEQIGEDSYRVSIPEFIFIGNDDVKFTLVAETGGALSFTAPKVNQVDMVNKVLNSKAQEKYIADNEDVLRDQAKFFYSGIIQAIDPKATLEFTFAPAAPSSN